MTHTEHKLVTRFEQDDGTPMIRCEKCGSEYEDTKQGVLREQTGMRISRSTTDLGEVILDLGCSGCDIIFKKGIRESDLVIK